MRPTRPVVAKTRRARRGPRRAGRVRVAQGQAAPSSRQRRAAAPPIPVPAPAVTTTTFPASKSRPHGVITPFPPARDRTPGSAIRPSWIRRTPRKWCRPGGTGTAAARRRVHKAAPASDHSFRPAYLHGQLPQRLMPPSRQQLSHAAQPADCPAGRCRGRRRGVPRAPPRPGRSVPAASGRRRRRFASRRR